MKPPTYGLAESLASISTISFLTSSIVDYSRMPASMLRANSSRRVSQIRGDRNGGCQTTGAEALSNSCAARLERACHSIAISDHAALVSPSVASRENCSQAIALSRYRSDELGTLTLLHIGGSTRLSVTDNYQKMERRFVTLAKAKSFVGLLPDVGSRAATLRRTWGNSARRVRPNGPTGTLQDPQWKLRPGRLRRLPTVGISASGPTMGTLATLLGDGERSLAA
jgi:hypothetical protein